MKKHLFPVIAAMALLASCSSDETLDVTQTVEKPIGFNSFVNKTTRAAESKIGTLQDNGFWVYGFMAPTNSGNTSQDNSSSSVTTIFNNVQVSYDSGTWSYDGVRYWTKDNSYGFTAIYPDPNTNTYLTFTPTSTFESDGTYDQGGEITFNNSVANAEVDLIADFQNVVKVDPTTQGMVNFSFNHYLSRIKFKFENDFTNNTIVVKALSLGSMDIKAKCHTATELSNVIWTLADDNSSFSKTFTFPGDQIAINSNKVSAYNYAIPQTAKQHTASFTVELYTAGILTGTYYFTNIPLPAIDMKPGYSYQYHAKLNAKNIDGGNELKPIEFGVTEVAAWGADNDVDIFFLGISKKDITLSTGTTFNLAPYISTADPLVQGTDYSVTYAYSSDNTEAATVSDAGIITAVAAGDANVTCTATVTVLRTIEPYATAGSTITLSQKCKVTVE